MKSEKLSKQIETEDSDIKKQKEGIAKRESSLEEYNSIVEEFEKKEKVLNQEVRKI